MQLSKFVSGICFGRCQASSCLFLLFAVSTSHKDWRLTFVWIHNLEEFLIFHSLLNLTFASQSLLPISSSHHPFHFTTLRRYVNVSTSSMSQDYLTSYRILTILISVSGMTGYFMMGRMLSLLMESWKRLLDVDIVHTPIPLCTLLNDVPQCKHLFRCNLFLFVIFLLLTHFFTEPSWNLWIIALVNILPGTDNNSIPL